MTDMFFEKDIEYKKNGDIRLVDGLTCLAQRITQRLSVVKKELWFDQDLGLEEYFFRDRDAIEPAILLELSKIADEVTVQTISVSEADNVRKCTVRVTLLATKFNNEVLNLTI